MVLEICICFPGKVPCNLIQNFIKAIKRILKRAGIEESFCLHDIRHTVTRLTINNGGALYEVQSTLAHVNVRVSKRHAYLSNDSLQDTRDNLSNVVAGLLEVSRGKELYSISHVGD